MEEGIDPYPNPRTQKLFPYLILQILGAGHIILGAALLAIGIADTVLHKFVWQYGLQSTWAPLCIIAAGSVGVSVSQTREHRLKCQRTAFVILCFMNCAVCVSIAVITGMYHYALFAFYKRDGIPLIVIPTIVLTGAEFILAVMSVVVGTCCKKGNYQPFTDEPMPHGQSGNLPYKYMYRQPTEKLQKNVGPGPTFAQNLLYHDAPPAYDADRGMNRMPSGKAQWSANNRMPNFEPRRPAGMDNRMPHEEPRSPATMDNNRMPNFELRRPAGMDNRVPHDDPRWPATMDNNRMQNVEPRRAAGMDDRIGTYPPRQNLPRYPSPQGYPNPPFPMNRGSPNIDNNRRQNGYGNGQWQREPNLGNGLMSID